MINANRLLEFATMEAFYKTGSKDINSLNVILKYIMTYNSFQRTNNIFRISTKNRFYTIIWDRIFYLFYKGLISLFIFFRKFERRKLLC